MRVLVIMLVLAAAAAGADAGDRLYLHHGVLARGWADAAITEPETRDQPGAIPENADIAMAAEEVEITLHPEYAEVVATFEFANTAAEKRDVEMCFPVTYGMLGLTSYDAHRDDVDFAARPCDLKITVADADTPYELEDTLGQWEFPALATWAVTFAAGERRRVECRYTDQYNGGGVNFDYSFVYIIYTGATWKGPIGRGKIIVQPGADFDWKIPLYYLAAGIPPARDEGDRIVWEFENLEPSYEARAAGVPRWAQYYDYARGLNGAGITVGFATPKAMASTYTDGVAYKCPPGEGAAAGILCPALFFYTAPSDDAPRVADWDILVTGVGIAVLERRGDWYRIRVKDGVEGWVHWRYVDAEAATESITLELVLLRP